MKLNKKRVVITGLGVISSIGIGKDEFWENLRNGLSGISRITSFDTSLYDYHNAGEVKRFSPKNFINKGKIRNLGRASQMIIAASKLALKDARIPLIFLKEHKTGLNIGTTMGESQVIEQILKHSIKKDKLEVRNMRALAYPAHSISVNLANELKTEGNNLIFSNACAAGNYSIGYAFDLINSGRLEFMLAGGVDAISRIAFTGFNRLFAMAPEICQPFDKNRKGMIIGEGAGVLFLESLDSAVKRNANIYAEILGYGLSCDASNMTIPSMKGISMAINKALSNSNLLSTEIQYINAHGTGTIENDKEECKAIRLVFGKLADKIPVSSIKSMLGHTMGAASAIETIACCLSIIYQEVPPTINLVEQDPECEIDCVPNQSRPAKLKKVINNSQAFGGNNCALVLGAIN